MTDYPPPGGASRPEDVDHLNDQPTQRINRPPDHAPPQQQAGYPTAQPEHYSSGNPASSFYPPPQGGYPVLPEANTSPEAGQPSPGAPYPAPDHSPYGYPLPARPGSGGLAFWHELTLLGQVAGVAGLLLLMFFFVPWSFTPDVSAASIQITNRIPTTWHSGWSTAAGVPLFGGTTSFNIFPHLWLVPISALALIVIAILLGRHRVSLRLAAALVALISLFLLLLEILFLVQINSFQAAIDNLAGGRVNQTLYGVSWGFWLTLVATVISLGVGIYLFYHAYAPGVSTTPQTPFPGDQQPYPTA